MKRHLKITIFSIILLMCYGLYAYIYLTVIDPKYPAALAADRPKDNSIQKTTDENQVEQIQSTAKTALDNSTDLLETPNMQIDEIKNNILLDVPSISQKPELLAGCEVTSLAMLLQYAKTAVDKMTLAQEVNKDSTPLVTARNGDILKWGDPNEGFVGDITGNGRGYAVYHSPIFELAQKYLPDKALDLTGQPFTALLGSLNEGRPVIVWTTIDLKMPSKFEEWEKDGRTIKAIFSEHAVLLVGYDDNNVYFNNPYNGLKNQALNKADFISVWESMGSQAVTYK